MTSSERRLMILMRVVGAVTALALVPTFMPRAWMAACHEALGFGPFPPGPMTEYLARSLSMFYAALGGLHLWLSLDVRARGRAIVAVGVITIAGGMILLATDIRGGMPWWWTIGEGPFVVALGTAYLVLQFRSRAEVRGGQGPGASGPGAKDGRGAEADVEGFLNP